MGETPKTTRQPPPQPHTPQPPPPQTPKTPHPPPHPKKNTTTTPPPTDQTPPQTPHPQTPPPRPPHQSTEKISRCMFIIGMGLHTGKRDTEARHYQFNRALLLGKGKAIFGPVQKARLLDKKGVNPFTLKWSRNTSPHPVCVVTGQLELKWEVKTGQLVGRGSTVWETENFTQTLPKPKWN